MGIERQRELRRRRSRRQKLQILKRKLTTANASERAAIVNKIRKLTPGAERVLAHLNLEER